MNSLFKCKEPSTISANKRERRENTKKKLYFVIVVKIAFSGGSLVHIFEMLHKSVELATIW